MAAFTELLEAATQRRFTSYADLHAFSVREFRTFWHVFLQSCRGPLGITGSADPVCVGDECEHARFFPEVQLNYADSVLNLAVAGADAPALREHRPEGAGLVLTRGALRDQVAALAQGLARLGVRAGHRVVAVMRNNARAVAFALAVTALGATLSTAAPDMGMQALVDRFAPLEPTVLAAHLAPQPSDAGLALPEKIAALAARIPTLRTVVRLDTGTLPPETALDVHAFDDLLDAPPSAFAWPRFGFDHPLFVMFSSGTTGKPKCIVHGAGGSLLEHVKEHRLHADLRPGERMYFHTSCGWMMWNWQLSALASGVEIVTYDGPIDSVERLWRLVAREQVAVFGTSPGYLKMCEEARLVPSTFGLDGLRAVMSTGAVLHDSQFAWVTRNAKDVPVQSISGGTDILGCFVLGHPDLPVRAGEAQCRSLGLDVQAWQDGHPSEGVGQLVCANPFPSRPLGFHGDADGSRFHAAYFAQNPGVWTHGDLVEFPAAGGARMHGRSDGVINVRGTKFWPGEIYRVLAGIPGIRDAMVVQRAGDEQQVVALLVLAPGVALDPALVTQVRREISAALSAAHVPDLVLDVPDLPVTHNGKASESAARAAVEGRAPSNLEALRNPECLAAIAAHPALQRPATQGQGEVADTSLAGKLASVWARHLGVAHVRPDDNFFELGGNSLLAARVLRDVQDLTGCKLPLSVLLQAPTVDRLVAVVQQQVPTPSPVLVRMREGRGAPLFMVHGLSGTVMECWGVVKALRTQRPVWGLQAPGVDGDETPLRLVQDLATTYVAHLRALQHEGPYAICGFSYGGLVAYEMARQLGQAGQAVEPLVLLDPYVHRDMSSLRRLAERAANASLRLARLPPGQAWAELRDRARGLRPFGPVPMTPTATLDMPAAQARVCAALSESIPKYHAQPHAAPVLFVHAHELLRGQVDPMPAWRRLVGAQLRVVELPGEHLDLVGRHAVRVAALLDEGLGAVRS